MTLREFFAVHSKTALAYSGGTDSTALLYAAAECGTDICAYYVKTAFQPRFELEDARREAEKAGVRLCVIESDILKLDRVISNPEDRCYYCKRSIFCAIAERAGADGYDVLIDGTNASDNCSDRPGMRALAELSVLSPLRECGITKTQVRRMLREFGSEVWSKPPYACLATRIPTGELITEQKLKKIECAEDYLFMLGFSDLRVRLLGGNIAKIQLPAVQTGHLLACRKEIYTKLKEDFDEVLFDLKSR